MERPRSDIDPSARRRGAQRLVFVGLVGAFVLGLVFLEPGHPIRPGDVFGTVVLSMPFLAFAAWAWLSGHRAFSVAIVASTWLLAVRFGTVEKGELVPIPVEVVVVYLLYRVGLALWERWRERTFGP